MELKDFTEKVQEQIKEGLPEKVQEQIKEGLPESEISDKAAAAKLLALVPEDLIKKIPVFVRKHATTKTIKMIASQFPKLYAVAKRKGELPEKEREELRKIITDIFKEKMYKHRMK